MLKNLLKLKKRSGPYTLNFIKRDVLASFALYAISAAVFTYPLIFHLSSSLYGPFFQTDIRGAVWSLWWMKHASLHQLSYNICPFLAAPFGVSFSLSPTIDLHFILARFLVTFMEPVFYLNFLTFAGFVLAGTFGYILCRYLSLNTLTSFLVGFIYAFSPYHLNKVMEFTGLFIGAWIPLFIIAVLKLKEKACFKNIIFAAIAFDFILVSNSYYAFITALYVAGELIFFTFYHWRTKFNSFDIRKSLNFISAIFFVFVFVFLFNAPSLISIAKNAFFHGISNAEKASHAYTRSFDYLFAQSARPLSYLLPASTHPIFGGFTKKMFGSIFYGRGSIEQTLYLGWTPLILAYFAFRQWRHKRSHPAQYPDYPASRENFYIGLFIFSAIFAFFCSLPPYADLGVFKIYFPSYYLYKALPMFRAYARFGILVSLSVSVLAGFGFKFILERIKEPGRKQLFTAAICFLILFEFTNIPPFRATDISKVPSVYKWLGEQRGDFIVAEYPMAMTSPGEALENYDYIFYQTKHQKRLVNGAIAGTGAFEIRKKILKINDPETINILKKLGVKYVILHNDLYKRGDYGDAADIVGEVPGLNDIAGWNLIKTFDIVYVYDIGDKPQKKERDAS